MRLSLLSDTYLHPLPQARGEVLDWLRAEGKLDECLDQRLNWLTAARRRPRAAPG